MNEQLNEFSKELEYLRQSVWQWGEEMPKEEGAEKVYGDFKYKQLGEVERA